MTWADYAAALTVLIPVFVMGFAFGVAATVVVVARLDP